MTNSFGKYWHAEGFGGMYFIEPKRFAPDKEHQMMWGFQNHGRNREDIYWMPCETEELGKQLASNDHEYRLSRYICEIADNESANGN